MGQTPIVKTTGARYKVNMISAITATGELKFATYQTSFTAEVFIDFLTRLMEGQEAPVFVVMDGHPVHRAKMVTTFVESTEGRLRLFRLPGY